MDIKNIASQVVKNGAEEYREYHVEFAQKGIFEKLWLVGRSLGTHMYYSYWATEPERQIYVGLLAYMSRRREKASIDK